MLPRKISTIMLANFNPEITNNADAGRRVLEEPNLGRPFFHALDTNPDAIVFTNTNKYGAVSHAVITPKNFHTGEPITADMLRALGFVASQPYMPHYIFENFGIGRYPLFRDSSDPNAVSITYIANDGLRADIRMIFVDLAGNQITTDMIMHRFNNSYERYKHFGGPAGAGAGAGATRGGKHKKHKSLRRRKTRRSKTNRKHRRSA